eukprot:TRINITY_DN1206_c0_g1_i1.p1 TRINITY_DN1206_c0_g1~~TRINITY_DN1206_c0_g1_i1.p1  ORF type:complete len:249 (+),score=53.28 TRINITY_DN1206_c0_g1_i1:23-769(+)
MHHISKPVSFHSIQFTFPPVLISKLLHIKMSSFAVTSVVLLSSVMLSCNAALSIFGVSSAVAGSTADGRVAFTDSETFTVDNIDFSRGLGSAQFRISDPSFVNGSAVSIADAQRGTAPSNITAFSDGFANSFVVASNPDNNGIIADGASLIDTFATPNSAGLNGSAAVEASMNGTGFIQFQNQAGGVASSQFGDANYNYTSRFNVSGNDATVADLVNVQLVSNENQTGSSLTICVGSIANCTNFTPGI